MKAKWGKRSGIVADREGNVREPLRLEVGCLEKGEGTDQAWELPSE